MFFFLSRRVQTGYGAHPASYRVDTGDFFPVRKADHLLTSSAEVNMWRYTFDPHTSVWRCSC